jgi:hypothetical protein
MPEKFLKHLNGFATEQEAIAASAGAADAGKIPALDASGRLSDTMMPVGVGADTQLLIASEALSAGNWVNVWNDGGVAKVRRADATGGLGKKCHGFVLAGVSMGANATVFFEGTNTAVSAQIPGDIFLGLVAGAGSATPPSAAGHIVQRLGVAVSATAVKFEADNPILLA